MEEFIKKFFNWRVGVMSGNFSDDEAGNDHTAKNRDQNFKINWQDGAGIEIEQIFDRKKKRKINRHKFKLFRK